MLEPKVVIACGICACSGGVFRDCYNTLGGVDVAIPVDVYAPGCAVRPEAIIDAVVAGLGVLEKKRADFAASGSRLAGKSALPAAPTAANKLVDGISVRAAFTAAGAASAAASAGAASSSTAEGSSVKRDEEAR
jgi:ech hydrogenase subunit C